MKRELFLACGASQPLPPPIAFLNDHFDRGVPIASYRPTANEADPAAINQIAYNSQMSISYPRIDADGVMCFYTIGPS
ncbi:MAG: hypothetical protein ABL874_03310, partial [Sphingopyxis sp.]